MQTVITLSCQMLLIFCLLATKLKVSVFRFVWIFVTDDGDFKRLWKICLHLAHVWKRLSGLVMPHRGAFRWQVLQLLLFHNLGTRRGCLVNFTPRPRFIPWERAPCAHCIWGWVGPSSGLDVEVRWKFSASVGDQTPAFQSAVIHYTDWSTPALLALV
jgi:hypothetical protein